MAYIAAFVVLAGCTPHVKTTPISAGTRTINPHPTAIPAWTGTPTPVCVSPGDMGELRLQINQMISTVNAVFGIGIYDFEDQDALFINRDERFAMMSVVKFPQAIAILSQIDEGIMNHEMQIHFERSDLRPDTYSPLRDERTENEFDISLSEALSYTISKSDNNVCDKLFEILGGTGAAEAYVHNLGLKSIAIGTNYADMGVNTIYANQSSPGDMLELLRMFYEHELLSTESRDLLWRKMVETTTGPDRIKGLLPGGTVVAHKTGTSGTDEHGFTAAFNDIGIVELPDGGRFAIVIFISNSKEDERTNARIIAEIAKLAYDYFREDCAQ
jgi:beta-lactamase class A